MRPDDAPLSVTVRDAIVGAAGSRRTTCGSVIVALGVPWVGVQTPGSSAPQPNVKSTDAASRPTASKGPARLPVHVSVGPGAHASSVLPSAGSEYEKVRPTPTGMPVVTRPSVTRAMRVLAGAVKRWKANVPPSHGPGPTS